MIRNNDAIIIIILLIADILNNYRMTDYKIDNEEGDVNVNTGEDKKITDWIITCRQNATIRWLSVFTLAALRTGDGSSSGNVVVFNK
jgi:hypothetical protein